METNKELIRRLHDGIWSYEKLHALHEFFADDFVFHSPNRDIVGLAAFRDAMAAELEAVGDLWMSVDEVVAEMDFVAVRFTSSFSHHGIFIGAYPKGESVVVHAQAFHRLRNGKIVETWHLYDRFSLLRSLGLFEQLRAPDQVEIREIIERARAHPDLYYADDAEIVTPDGGVLRGAEAIAEWYAGGGGESKVNAFEIEGVGDLAYVRGTCDMDGPSPTCGPYLEIWRKRPGCGWRVVKKFLAGPALVAAGRAAPA
jgi:predicted ester cyclase